MVHNEFTNKMNLKSCKVKNFLKKSGENSNVKLKRIKRRLGAVWNGFSRYSEKSTIHGVRYLGARKQHWSERIWWIITIIIAAVLCACSIYQTFIKISPMVITFDDESTPISKIPFPTVTLCNSIKVVPSILYYSYINQQMLVSNYTNILPEKVIQQMYALSTYCRENAILEYIKRNNITIDRNILPYLQQISPTWTNSYCSLLPGQKFDCKEASAKRLNNFGLCYSFNHQSSEKIYSEKVADDFEKFNAFFIKETNTSYPYYVQKTTQGFSEIAIFFPNSDRNVDHNCNNFFDKDYLFLYVHPAEDQFTEEIPIPLDHFVHVRVRPKKISTDRNLIASVSKAKRKCVDVDENNLVFYRNYSQTNCYYEKLIRKTIEDCKCAYFWMPRWNNTPLCNASDIKCFNEVKASFAKTDLSTECIPACNSLTYEAQITELKASRYKNGRFIKIAIGFGDQQYLFMKRSEIYGKVDFYVGCAGILSLFMGVSFLSIGEILYHATLRPYLDQRKRQRAIKKSCKSADRNKNKLSITITLKPILSSQAIPKINANAINKY